MQAVIQVAQATARSARVNAARVVVFLDVSIHAQPVSVTPAAKIAAIVQPF